MFQNSGLSLNQAPPIEVVLRFFIAGAFFGVIGGFALAVLGDSFLEFSSSGTLALTHIFTIGVMLSFMLGALFQMLPVLASVVINEPKKKSLKVQYGLIFGFILLAVGFFDSFYLSIGGAILVATIIFVSILMLKELLKVKTHSPSSKGMAFALFNLILLTVFALILVLIRGGVLGLNIDYLSLKELHFSFGLLGWIVLLIIAVSFQVVEMFYVTKAFPKRFANSISLLVTALLILKLLLITFSQKLALVADISIGILILAYGVVTLKNLFNQKRRVIEATILFWRVGVGALVVFGLLFVVNAILNNSLINQAEIITFATFAFSIIFGMVYKIVPFLVWFHLNAQGYFNAPMMHEVISPKYSKAHFYLHLATIFFSIISLFIPTIWSGVGMLLGVSFGVVFVSIYRAWHKYLDTKKSGQKMEFNFS